MNDARERLHPDPERAHDARPRIRRGGGPLDGPRRRARRTAANVIGRGSATRSDTTAASRPSRSTSGSTSIRSRSLATRSGSTSRGITVFVTRLLPIVRTVSSVPAAPPACTSCPSSLYTAAGCFIWMLASPTHGYQVGENWRDLQEKLHLFDYVIAACIIGAVAYFGMKWWRGRGAAPRRPPNALAATAGCRGRERPVPGPPGGMSLPAPARAAIVGVVHGALEWLPVSSSGHVALLVDRAGWPEADPANARASAHARGGPAHRLPAPARPAGARRCPHERGAAPPPQRRRGRDRPHLRHRRRPPGHASRSASLGRAPSPLASSPGRWRCSSPNASRRRPAGASPALTPADVLVVGAAQGCAIWPGVSRRAATLAAARARGLDPATADALSWAGWPPDALGATPGRGTATARPSPALPRPSPRARP